LKTTFPKNKLLEERDRPGRSGARLATHFFADSLILRIGHVQREGGPECVWRDANHRARDARAPRNCRALTILEMLVSTAMLSFIVLGLTAMFIQTQKAFKTGIKQTTVTDAGRTIIDMIASDLSQMSDPHFTNVYFPTNGLGSPPTLRWSFVPAYELVQTNQNGYPLRTNELEDIFATVQTNNLWLGIGYTVSNWFTTSGGGAFPGIGTLYRYVGSNTAPLFPTNQLYTNYINEIGSNTFTNAWFHRVADGVVHLKIYAFEADGNEMCWEPYYDQNGQVYGFPPQDNYLQYPVIVTNSTIPITYQTNYLPHSIDIELGILEPEAFEHARALFTSGATNAAATFLATAAGQVEIFRQHIIIPAAP
jgi:type II secretory pathway pseudopilin PulG